MKRLILFCLALFYITNYSFSQFNLDISITGLKNSSGNIMLQLFDEHEKIVLQEMSPIEGEKCHFLLKDLKSGKYAVRYFHDENVNGKLESNIVGKPTEGYGFSNNVTGRFGPPPFDKWLFDLTGDKKIVLKPTY